ncbi:MAG: efflux RND transporter permease subunit [Burkholderiales bacterium]|nr:efflux RND transporter permease subunit [Burkholderiales bacterium]
MWLTRISVRNPVFATMMMAAFLVLGLFSYFRLPVEQFPDVAFPVVVVQTEYPGASPETVESDLTRRIEEAVNTVSGIKQISSRSYEGLSLVIAEFQLTVDPAVAAQDVREKVAIIKPTFRKEVKEPKVSRFNPDDLPVVSIALRSETRSPRELTTLADQVIRKRIENVRGVGQVTIVGGVKREVQVLLRPADLEAMGVGVDQVVNAIRAENQELPAGSLTAREREQMVQVQARLERPVDFNRIIVARRGGQPVFLSQVATVVDGQEEEENLALVDGRRAVALDVVKAQDANTIETVDGVKAAIAAVAKTLPPDVSIEIVRDTSEGIRNSVNNVKRTLVEGAALTVLIVFLFLNSWRSTIITGLTLPISLIGTFLVMYAFGFTVNMLTLMALSITVGLLIDDAIVVRENIVRHLGMGKGHRQASLDGTQEIGLAVLATTFTIVAVFLPVGFMGGIIGRFFHQFGITVAAAVILSMFVSFTLDPMLSAVWYDPAAHGEHGKGRLARLTGAFERFQERLAERYSRLIRWALGHRKAVIAAAVGTFLGAFALVPLIGSEFVPEADLGEIMVQVNTPVGSSLDFTRQKVQQAEAALREFPEVRYTYATINTGTALGRNYATIFAKLLPRKERKLSQKQLQVPIRERLSRIAGLTVTYVGVFNAVGSGKPLQVSIQGPDTKVLERLSGEVVAVMRGVEGAVDVDTSLKQAKPTIAVRMNRELASDLGVGVDRVGAALRPLIAGEAASTWRAPDDETYEVKVRLARSDRASTADLERIYVASQQTNADGSPKMVALRQVADFAPALGATQINRKDLTREVLVTANVSGKPAGDLGAAIKAELDRIQLPPGYRFVMGGSTKDIQALMVTRSTLNIFSIIGFVMLMGLVTKNAILLVDFVNQAVKRGAARADAIVEAGRVRLRPILMTTFAMVFGMIPLALGLGEGGEQRAPMGIAVIGGVIASTLLTLVVVPVLYTYLDDMARAARRRTRGDIDARAEREADTQTAG